MEKRFEKNRYFGLKHEPDVNNSWVVLGEDFETLAKFKEYCLSNGLIEHFCPLNVASSMIGNYKLVKPQTINQIDFSKLSLNSLCEIYAASFGMCAGWSNPVPLRKTLEYQREKGALTMPVNPSVRLQKEISI